MEYPKIETLFDRDPADMKRVLTDRLRDPAFGIPLVWMLTEKIDGTNIRLILKDGSVSYAGRTADAQLPPHLLAALQRDFPSEKVAAAFEPGTHAIVFGEGYGPKIQKGGGLYRADPGFIVFDVAVLAGRVWWLEWDAVKEVAAKIGAPTVPVVAGQATIPEAVLAVSGGLRSVEAKEPRIAEGVVARTVPGLLMRNGQRLVWKLKGRDLGAPE